MVRSRNLSSVATDGEIYGHHHKHGEMALAYALRLLEKDKTVRLTNYGSFLDQFPPEYECEIDENTSWSCAHGVDRWRSDCGCNGGQAGCNQQWRAPLRAGTGRVARCAGSADRAGGRKAFQRCVGRARRLHSRDSGPQAESVDRFFPASTRITRSTRQSASAL